ncbi:MAG TPA: hypothetical protein VNZ64_27710 [Candidatus Acidoferrum sp.]|nr:hypothetical protein [Candidatus Acidoferrum sp.]
MKILAQAVAAFLVIGLMVYAALKSGGRRARVAFKPDPANDKEVLVQGWTEAELKEILKKFQTKYADRLGSNFLATMQTEPKHVRLRFPNDMPPEEFGFLVNYLQYPEDFDLASRDIVALGRVTLGRDFNLPDEKLAGQKAHFYIPSNDEDCDVVYVRVGDRTFENSFASWHWKVVTDNRVPRGVEF